MAPSFSIFGRIVAKSYALLPFTLISCLGLFPLTVLESLTIGALLTGFCATAMIEHPLSSPIAYGWDSIWLLILLGLIASLSSLAQLQLLLLNEKKD
jgi:hypothetical protein